MISPYRQLGCLVLLLAIGGCGQASVRSERGDSVSPSPHVRPLRDTGGEGILAPGTYVLDQLPVDVAFDIPDGSPPGWHVGYSRADVATILWYTPPEITYGFAFWTADNVYADPCDPASGEAEPPIGPSVDDLVAALSSLPEFRATAAVDISVGAFRGKGIELTAVGAERDCPRAIAWTGGEDTADLSPGETLPAQVLDVGGTRIVMRTLEPAEPDPSVKAELNQILDSIRIESLP